MIWGSSVQPNGQEEQLNTLIDSRTPSELRALVYDELLCFEELEQFITPRCSSRLVYPAEVLEVTGPDLRKLCR